MCTVLWGAGHFDQEPCAPSMEKAQPLSQTPAGIKISVYFNVLIFAQLFTTQRLAARQSSQDHDMQKCPANEAKAFTQSAAQKNADPTYAGKKGMIALDSPICIVALPSHPKRPELPTSQRMCRSSIDRLPSARRPSSPMTSMSIFTKQDSRRARLFKVKIQTRGSLGASPSLLSDVLGAAMCAHMRLNTGLQAGAIGGWATSLTLLALYPRVPKGWCTSCALRTPLSPITMEFAPSFASLHLMRLRVSCISS
jgi:hypothetical protein